MKKSEANSRPGNKTIQRLFEPAPTAPRAQEARFEGGRLAALSGQQGANKRSPE